MCECQLERLPFGNFRRVVRTAVGFRTGPYEPDFHALATESAIVLPWDREVLVNGELVPNPAYEGML